MATNVTHHPSPHLSRTQRFQQLKQQGLTIWLTGLSGSGKSTIGCAVESRLVRGGVSAYRLDGDNLRFGLNRDLGFSAADRSENIRRVAEVARLFADSGCVAITSFISPYRDDRRLARRICEDEGALPFVEIWIDVPLHVAEQRDPKGLYRKARSGEIRSFTGVSPDAPYEEPSGGEEDLRIRTDQVGVERAVEMIVGLLEERGLVGLRREGEEGEEGGKEG